MGYRFLVVDDEPNQRRMLSEYLENCGHVVTDSGSAEEALEFLGTASPAPEVILTDLRLPGADGVELIRRARAAGNDAAFIVITAFGSISNAVEAVHAGAIDYLTKPIRLDDLDATIAKITRPAPAPESAAQRQEPGPLDGYGAKIEELRALIDRVAPSDATILLTGESGTGKELAAARVHRRSSRSDGPFVKVNCAALTDSLLEAELFGYEKGAFTGAHEQRPGLFEAASGGTLLLDEIGDISPELQVRLLRVLQEREVLRVGSRTPIPVDFRLIAATHRDLAQLVQEEKFRQDLLYRLQVVRANVPPLRERREDIPVLCERLLQRLAKRNRVLPKPLDAAALEHLARLEFPGNVRQLEHMLERALVLAVGETIVATDFEDSEVAETPAETPENMREAVEQLERAWITDALRRTGDVRAHAAKLLGIPERVLRYKINKYGIDANRQK